MSSKFFNKLDKGASKFFSKSSGDLKMLGRSARKIGKEVGGALGSAGGEVKKAAQTIEKATAGTPISGIAGKVAAGADIVQRTGRATKAISGGDVKGGVAQVKGVVKDVKAFV
jgi:hypothetical protein